jgi:hypothetical protein
VYSELKAGKDNLEFILDDAVSSGKISSERRKIVAANLAIFWDVLQKQMDEEMGKDKRFAMTFPKLDHMHTATSSFVVYDKDYDAINDRAETYDPAGCKSEFVTVIQIDTDSFEDKATFCFAVRQPQLERMINRLQLARRQLMYAKDKCSHA